MKKVYISGPMSGMPEHNFPAFNAEASRLRALGYDVVNPVDINPDPGTPWQQCLRKDLQSLLDCDTIALLPGWLDSKGAHLELHVAHRVGMTIKLCSECTGSAIDEPVPTISAQGTHIAEVRAFLVKFYGSGGQWAACDEPMHTIPTKDRMGLVTVEGQDYVIADIGMRMLQPRELARAQGFGDSYQLEAIFDGKRLSKQAQVRMIGNSVCPPLAAAIVRANYSERDALREAA